MAGWAHIRGSRLDPRRKLLSLEEKHDEVRQLIEIGKEKGYLLYDEVNELLPPDITKSDELDELFTAFGNAGIEVVDSEQKYRERTLLDRRGEGSDGIDLDLTPSAVDKTNDPVRMYLREMATVPLLSREGEVEIAKRIERGKLSITSRSPRGHRRIYVPIRRASIFTGRTTRCSRQSGRR